MWLTILYLGYKYTHNAFTQKVKMTSLDSKTVQQSLLIKEQSLNQRIRNGAECNTSGWCNNCSLSTRIKIQESHRDLYLATTGNPSKNSPRRVGIHCRNTRALEIACAWLNTRPTGIEHSPPYLVVFARVVQKCSYLNIPNCWTVMWLASTVYLGHKYAHNALQKKGQCQLTIELLQLRATNLRSQFAQFTQSSLRAVLFLFLL